ncbi:MAG: DUF881 domain-containing protein [Micrococcales bacterium]|nr:DUF881 domain-containing protein [Micrococcales bacterium]
MSTTGAPTEPSGQHRAEAPSGWPTIRRLLAPRLTRGQLVIGVLCALLGFAVVMQVRQTSEANLSGLSQAELVRIADAATDRADALAREAADLEGERDALVSGSNTREAALAAAERNAQVQGILTGRLPAVGPGVEITVADPNATVRPLTLLNMLEELRNAGAEAVSIGETRVVASSAFTGAPGRVLLDGQLLTRPYRWTAIGDPTTVAAALEIPGGAIAAIRRDGGEVTVRLVDEVTISATTTPVDPVYATPVPDTPG